MQSIVRRSRQQKGELRARGKWAGSTVYGKAARHVPGGLLYARLIWCGLFLLNQLAEVALHLLVAQRKRAFGATHHRGYAVILLAEHKIAQELHVL